MIRELQEYVHTIIKYFSFLNEIVIEISTSYVPCFLIEPVSCLNFIYEKSELKKTQFLTNIMQISYISMETRRNEYVHSELY